MTGHSPDVMQYLNSCYFFLTEGGFYVDSIYIYAAVDNVWYSIASRF